MTLRPFQDKEQNSKRASVRKRLAQVCDLGVTRWLAENQNTNSLRDG